MRPRAEAALDVCLVRRADILAVAVDVGVAAVAPGLAARANEVALRQPAPLGQAQVTGTLRPIFSSAPVVARPVGSWPQT